MKLEVHGEAFIHLQIKKVKKNHQGIPKERDKREHEFTTYTLSLVYCRKLVLTRLSLNEKRSQRKLYSVEILASNTSNGLSFRALLNSHLQNDCICIHDYSYAVLLKY